MDPNPLLIALLFFWLKLLLKSGDISFLFASLTLRTPGREVHFGVCHTFFAKSSLTGYEPLKI